MRRNFTTILIASVLGIITAAAATGSGVLMIELGLTTMRTFYLSNDAWFVFVADSPTNTMISATIDADDVHLAPPFTTDPRLPAWHSGLQRPQLDSQHTGYHMAQTVSGWPFHAVRFGHELYEYHDGSVDALPYPLRLYWSGLLANFATFTFAWLIAIRLPGVVRRGRRLNRSECTACGYDLRGKRESDDHAAVCSECGRDSKRARHILFQDRCLLGIAAAATTGLILIATLAS